MKRNAVRALLMLLGVASSSAAQGLSAKCEELTGRELVLRSSVVYAFLLTG